MILLDTHVVIWLMLSPDRLSVAARKAILGARISGEDLAISPVSLYEIAYAARKKRLAMNSTTEAFVAAIQSRLVLVPLTPAIAVCAGQLSAPFHGDPIDRLIAGTAIVEECVLITRDAHIRDAGVCKVLW
jgi:PIN domain nuclease of toxin-antitoxin system